MEVQFLEQPKAIKFFWAIRTVTWFLGSDMSMQDVYERLVAPQ